MSKTLFVSDKSLREMNQLISLDELALIVYEKFAGPDKENWSDILNVLKQAMHRGRLKTHKPRQKGRVPMFNQQNVKDYLEYLENRPYRGGAKKVHHLLVFRHLLGQKTDSLISIIAGCSQNTVYKYRAELGIRSTRSLDAEGKLKSRFVTESEIDALDLPAERIEAIKKRLNTTS